MFSPIEGVQDPFHRQPGGAGLAADGTLRSGRVREDEMQVGDRVQMRDTGRTGTIAAVDAGEGVPVYTVLFDVAPDAGVGPAPPLESEPATMVPGLPAEALEAIA